jgi:hypothetical protein
VDLTPRTTWLTVAGLAVALTLPLAGCATRRDGAGVAGEQAAPSSTPSSTAPSGGPVSPALPGSPVAPSGRPGDPPLSSTVLPTMRPPTRPPDEPTDRIRPHVIGGHLTRGGSGPCYGLVTDDGVEYALYGRDAGTLAKGARVLVTIAPLQLRIDCGSGRPASIVKITEIR